MDGHIESRSGKGYTRNIARRESESGVRWRETNSGRSEGPGWAVKASKEEDILKISLAVQSNFPTVNRLLRVTV